jgi:hydrogenase-4 component E
MPVSHYDLLAAVAAMIAVWMCGVTSVRGQIAGLAAQSALPAGICLLLGAEPGGGHFLALAAMVLLVKALGIPLFLRWSAARLGVRRDAGVGISSTQALFAGCGILAVGLQLAPRVAVPSAANPGSAGMALSLLLTGMLLMLTRRLALSQVIGFLTLENGIFLYGLTQTRGMPLLLEMAIAFEVLVAVLIAGLVIHRLDESFAHTDVTRLRGLRH